MGAKQAGDLVRIDNLLLCHRGFASLAVHSLAGLA